jgi:hypothetical protein
MTENQKPATEETYEIDDEALDQVVGGVSEEQNVENSLKRPATIKPGTSSFGGEEWEKR